MSSLTETCLGRWPGILTRFGVDPRFLSGRHGPCPVCGGHDRFRFDDKQGRGTFICSKCGAGDGFALLQRLKGWGFKEAASEIEQVVGKIEAKAPNSKEQSDRQLRDMMNRLWRSGDAVTLNDPVASYLANRAIHLDNFPAELRYVAKCAFKERGATSPSYHPAMIARVRGPDAAPATIHRTYLDAFGAKANVSEVRKLMPGKVPAGSAIWLATPGPVMGIAEGIESALSASLIWAVPVWAAINTNMLIQFEPPADVEKLMIFGDNDAAFAGQQAAYALAHKLKIKRPEIEVEVCMPPDAGTDWNDVLRNSRMAPAPARLIETAEIAQ